MTAGLRLPMRRRSNRGLRWSPAVTIARENMLLATAMDGVAATEGDAMRLKEVHHRERGFAAVAARRGDGNDQIAERELGAAGGF